MKFVLSASAKPAEASFSAEESMNSLNQMLDQLRAAAEAYREVESEFNSVAEVLHDATAAVKAIEEFGVSPATMSLYNKGNELDEQLGLEALDLTSIAKLADDVKKARKADYIAKLNASIEGAGQTFVDVLKKFWDMIKDVFTKMFGSNAMLIKTLNGLSDELSKPDPAKTVKAITFDGCDTILNCAESIAKEMNKVKGIIDEAAANKTKIVLGSIQIDASKKILDKLGYKVEDGKITGEIKEEYKFKEGTIKDLNWAADNNGLLKRVKEQLNNAEAKNLAKSIDRAMAQSVKVAKDVNLKVDGVEMAKKIRQDAADAMKILSFHSKLVRMVALSLLAVARAHAKVNATTQA